MKSSQWAVYFNHGKESGPWGAKIQSLAQVARDKGFFVDSLDYTGIHDPDQRVQILLASRAAEFERLVLVGSSMGSYVATVASQNLKPQGLFLMAPAFYLPGFANQDPVPHAQLTAVVHGWNDELIPVEHSLRFAQVHAAQLHLLPGDHRLVENIPFIAAVFSHFLDQLLGSLTG